MRILFLTFLSAFLAACSDKAPPSGSTSDIPVVYTTNYPLAYFAERIGEGTDLKIVFPEISGDPAFWKPSDDEISAFQSADLIVRNGATYEKWIKTVSLPESTQRDTSKAFSGDFIAEESAVTHTHGDGEAHSHAGTAFTTWLDFQQAIWQAEEVRDAMIELVPSEQVKMEENFNRLADELDELHVRMKKAGAGLDGHAILASHPVFQYLARRYNLNIKSLHWEPTQELSDQDLADLKKLIADHPAKVMMWEGDPNPASVATLKEMGIDSAVFDPCGNRPDSGDFISVMKKNVERLSGLSSKQD